MNSSCKTIFPNRFSSEAEESLEINRKLVDLFHDNLSINQNFLFLSSDDERLHPEYEYDSLFGRNTWGIIDSAFCDGWNNPVLFTYATPENLTKMNPEFKTNDEVPFVFWSMGNNGINEFGYGDDIFLNREIPLRFPFPSDQKLSSEITD